MAYVSQDPHTQAAIYTVKIMSSERKNYINVITIDVTADVVLDCVDAICRNRTKSLFCESSAPVMDDVLRSST